MWPKRLRFSWLLGASAYSLFYPIKLSRKVMAFEYPCSKSLSVVMYTIARPVFQRTQVYGHELLKLWGLLTWMESHSNVAMACCGWEVSEFLCLMLQLLSPPFLGELHQTSKLPGIAQLFWCARGVGGSRLQKEQRTILWFTRSMCSKLGCVGLRIHLSLAGLSHKF